MSAGEVRHMAKGLKFLIVPELAIVVEVDGQVVGASFGLVFLDRTAGAPDQALDVADAAMYEAKARGGGVKLGGVAAPGASSRAS